MGGIKFGGVGVLKFGRLRIGVVVFKVLLTTRPCLPKTAVSWCWFAIIPWYTTFHDYQKPASNCKRFLNEILKMLQE